MRHIAAFFQYIAALPGKAWRAMMAAGSLRLWAIILGAPPLTVFAVWLTYRVTDTGWPETLRELQLTILGNALYITLGLIAIIVVALSLVTVRATLPGGASLSIGGESPTVITTTTTKLENPNDDTQ